MREELFMPHRYRYSAGRIKKRRTKILVIPTKISSSALRRVLKPKPEA